MFLDDPDVHGSADVDDDYGKYTSMKFDSAGIPIFVPCLYRRYHLYSLDYAYFKGGSAGNCGDDNDWQCEPITWDTTPRGLYTSLDIDCRPDYIAYYEEDQQRLDYATSFGYDNCGQVTSWHCEN